VRIVKGIGLIREVPVVQELGGPVLGLGRFVGEVDTELARYGNSLKSINI
jgi:hypothetical protein